MGLGTFLAQVFLRRPLTAAGTREFHVSGSWADPKVEKIERKPDAPVPRSTCRIVSAGAAQHLCRLRCHEDRRRRFRWSGASLEANLDSARRLIAQAAVEGAASSRCRNTSASWAVPTCDKLAIAEASRRRLIQLLLAEPAAATACGWWAARCRSARIRSACSPAAASSPDGCAARYDKIHLFRFERRERRRPRELRRGPRASWPAPRRWPAIATGLRVGLSVCYDLRFP